MRERESKFSSIAVRDVQKQKRTKKEREKVNKFTPKQIRCPNQFSLKTTFMSCPEA